jgi:hypothetical protein
VGLEFCTYLLYLSDWATNFLVNNMTGPGAALAIIGALVSPWWGAVGARIAAVGAAIFSLGWFIGEVNRWGGHRGGVIELDFVRYYAHWYIWWWSGYIYGSWHFAG